MERGGSCGAWTTPSTIRSSKADQDAGAAMTSWTLMKKHRGSMHFFQMPTTLLQLMGNATSTVTEASFVQFNCCSRSPPPRIPLEEPIQRGDAEGNAGKREPCCQRNTIETTIGSNRTGYQLFTSVFSSLCSHGVGIPVLHL